MRSAAAFLLGVLLAGCQGTPRFESVHRLSSETEALAGDRVAPAVEAQHGGVIRDVTAEQRMHRVGLRLTRDVPRIKDAYRFRLLDSTGLNAISLPGGRVYITRGLYERLETDEQVAAVLAHEIAHIALRDHFKPRCGDNDASLQREQAADRLAVSYLREAGMKPAAMIEVVTIIRNTQPAGWSDRRIRALARRSF